MTQQTMWQWVSNLYGPQGWFSDEDKRQVERSHKFSGGHWRIVSQQEIEEHYRWLRAVAYRGLADTFLVEHCGMYFPLSIVELEDEL